MSVVTKAFVELTPRELYAFLKLRSDVFMLEQRVDDVELDGRDLEPGTRHLWITDEWGCAAYLRVLENPRPEYRDAHLVIGRVVVRADRRGAGLARELMEAALEVVGDEASVLHAQSHVVGLYTRFGYEPYGEEYVEAGMPHRGMYRAAPGKP
ncbi:GNAT family N-acetyltransferase [Brooklawnia cerclae]|uniref:ElaA protein n=1 Tax=Brooklawnia cerclae TaxID=349934 RepID=A0ABX0SLC0_9ACTN|nr:GNAT family N-acetyltransferase [Brooklawnia cerclae]NIH57840.1 ElaA protein [Brooklawnia cerclae]